MPFSIIRQDITKMQVDAIVNAANTMLAMGSGVCGAIFDAAGPAKLQAACDKLAPIHTGQAVITRGFALPCRFVIHAAGPVYNRQEKQQSEQQLRAAYTNSLQLAAKNDCESIAFPLISSGIYGYPKAEALRVATAAITDYLQTTERELQVYLVVFDKDAVTVGEALWGDITAYIDEHYVEKHTPPRRRMLEVEERGLFSAQSVSSFMSAPCMAPEPMPDKAPAPPLEDLIGHLDEPFSATLLRLIDKKGKTDVEVYKRANIDRKLFSKIRKGNGYMPGKRTILALAVALELTLPETESLLRCAGYALSHSHKFDVIVEYFIVNGRYDIFEMNEVLFKYDQPLLGA